MPVDPPTRAPRVSVVIRTKNEQALIGQCLEAILSQQPQENIEIVIIDSGSTDSTLDICRKYPVTVYSIPPEDFSYSNALNYGFERCQGRYIISVSAHAIPCDSAWLHSLLEVMKDERVAGVCSREIPHPDADFYERRRLNEAFGPTKKLYDRASLGQGERFGDFVFSNVSSCIRKAVWQGFPFPEVPYSEDRRWAERAIAEGFVIAYEPRSRIFHSHSETLNERVERAVAAYKSSVMDGGNFRTLNFLSGLVPRVLRHCRYVLLQQTGFGSKLYWGGYFLAKECSVAAKLCLLRVQGWK